MKKVVIITNAPAPYRVAFFKYLQEQEDGYEFHIIYISENEDIGRHWVIPEEELGNHTFLDCRVITIKRRYDDKRIVLSVGVTEHLKALSPDIVICMEYNVTIIQAVHWCMAHRVPFISWSDGTANSERNIGKMQHKFRKYVIKRAAGFISSSTATMEHQISYGADPKKCHKSLLTVDIDKYLYKKPGQESTSADTLLYVGSLIGRKGVDLLLAAFAKTDPSIRLVLVGEGSEENVLQAQAKELGIASRVEFRGYLEGEELKACYKQADAFVLPTREDCYGLVILEAMCASLPVIASKYADGARDIICDRTYTTPASGTDATPVAGIVSGTDQAYATGIGTGVNTTSGICAETGSTQTDDAVCGMIVDPCDADAFADAIDYIFSDESNLHKMQENSYNRAQEFRFEKVAGGFYEALEQVIKEVAN
jgi:glycosyltransferase involved in cell wall biosynthesis